MKEDHPGRPDFVLPLLPEVVAELLRWREESGRAVGPVFPDRGESSLTAHLKASGRRCGLDLSGWHRLRHSCASWLRRHGLALHLVSRYLDHGETPGEAGSADATATYLHAQTEELRAALAAIPALLGKRSAVAVGG